MRSMRWTFHLKIRARLVLSFLVLAVVPLTIVNIFAYHKFESSIERQTTASAQASLQQISSNVDTYMLDLISIAKVIVLDRSIVQWLQKPQDTGASSSVDQLQKRYKEELDIRYFLNAQKGSRPYIRGIYLLSADADRKIKVRSGTDTDLLPDRLADQPWWPEVLQSTPGVFVAPHTANYYKLRMQGPKSINLFYPIPSQGANHEWVFVHMSADVLLGEFETGIGYAGQKVGLIDLAGKAVLGHEDVLNPTSDELAIRRVSPVTGWTIAASIPYEQLFSSSREARGVTLTITAAAGLLGLLLALAFSKHVLKPLRLLRNAIRNTKTGSFQNRVQVLGNDEIGELSSSYNEMLDTICALLNRVKEEEGAKKDAELKALQYQINPHFLYNTLNSVQWLAVMHGVPQIKELLAALIKLLQSSLGKKGPFVTLTEELEDLRNYILIQQYRFGQGLAVDYQIDPEAGRCIVPRLILQPLVENSIFHGLEDGTGHIWIEAKMSGTTLLLSVTDDGIGMTPEEVEQLLHSESDFAGKFSGIGIPNVAEKIKRLYGSPYGISIMSEVGQGTKVLLSLPIREG